MDIEELMQKAALVQSAVEEMKEKLELSFFEGTSLDGDIIVQMQGNFWVASVTINPSLLAQLDNKTLQRSIKVALNEAWLKREKAECDEIERIHKSLNLPPGFQMPF